MEPSSKTIFIMVGASALALFVIVAGVIYLMKTSGKGVSVEFVSSGDETLPILTPEQKAVRIALANFVRKQVTFDLESELLKDADGLIHGIDCNDPVYCGHINFKHGEVGAEQRRNLGRAQSEWQNKLWALERVQRVIH